MLVDAAPGIAEDPCLPQGKSNAAFWRLPCAFHLETAIAKPASVSQGPYGALMLSRFSLGGKTNYPQGRCWGAVKIRDGLYAYDLEVPLHTIGTNRAPIG